MGDGEVVRRHEGRFTTYNREPGVPGVAIPGLGDDGRGNLVIHYYQYNFDEWRQVYAHEVRAYRWSEDRFLPAEELKSTLSIPPVPYDEAQSNTATKFIEDGQGGLWLGSSGGLTHYKYSPAGGF